MPLEIVRSDITRMRVDAIVADAAPARGGEAAYSAIHRAAGPELMEEYRALGGCRPGEAVLTGAYRLPCRYVIHTVGPAWHGGESGEEACLRACYLNALAQAEERACASVAVPLIAAGEDGCPTRWTAKTAVRAIRDWLINHEMVVYLVILDREPFAIPALLSARIRAFGDTISLSPLPHFAMARPDAEACERREPETAHPRPAAAAQLEKSKIKMQSKSLSII